MTKIPYQFSDLEKISLFLELSLTRDSPKDIWLILGPRPGPSPLSEQYNCTITSIVLPL